MRTPNGEYGEAPDPNVESILQEMLDILKYKGYAGNFVIYGAWALIKAANDFGYRRADRYTSDLDLIWFNREEWKSFFNECEDIFTSNSKLGIVYRLSDYTGRHHQWNHGRLFFDILGRNTGEVVARVGIDLVADKNEIKQVNSDFAYKDMAYLLCNKLDCLAK
jgi:hypothetical protein